MEPVPQLVVADAAAWRTWLERNESASAGVWLILAKKGTSDPTSLNYQQALEEALCSGWIDGRRQAVDRAVFQQHFTPRRAASVWSLRNTGIVTSLIKAGRMRARGQEEIDRAQADGRWGQAYAGQAAAEVPEDLAVALRASPGLAERFEGLSRSDRYAVIHRVVTARTEATRQNRIRRCLENLEGPAGSSAVGKTAP